MQSEKNTETVAESETDKLWKILKDKKIGMFSLPDQKVSDHVARLVDINGFLYLKLKKPYLAVVPYLESVIKSEGLILEQANEYLIIKTP